MDTPRVDAPAQGSATSSGFAVRIQRLEQVEALEERARVPDATGAVAAQLRRAVGELRADVAILRRHFERERADDMANVGITPSA